VAFLRNETARIPVIWATQVPEGLVLCGS
jgi:hypothetical protein